MKTLLTTSAIVLMSVTAAAAQAANSTTSTQNSATVPSASSGNAGQPNSTSTANNEPMRQQVRDNLTKAGFTDIKIMPTSFMVRAKDQSGNPVMMVINPDSFTEVTTLPATNNNQTSTQNSNAPAQKP